MFKCKELERKAYKYELYEHIYSWLKEQDTQQMLLDMIMATLFNQPIIITQEYENYWRPTKCNLWNLTRLQVMQGVLPTGMWQKQHKYYVYIRSSKQGIMRDTKLCEKLIEGTHSLWMKRNSFEHDRKLYGL